MLTLLTNIAQGFDCLPYSVPEEPIVEFRVSYFYPQSREFRKMFHNGVADFQLTGTLPVFACACSEWLRGLNLWGAADYFTRKGYSHGCHDKTRITLVPLTLGGKYFFPSYGKIIPLNFYAASGMKYYFLRNHNHSDEVRKKIYRRGIGAVIELGVIATIADSFIFDVFASYSFKTFGRKSYSNPAVEYRGLKVSGFNIGAGIGYKF